MWGLTQSIFVMTPLRVVLFADIESAAEGVMRVRRAGGDHEEQGREHGTKAIWPFMVQFSPFSDLLSRIF